MQSDPARGRTTHYAVFIVRAQWQHPNNVTLGQGLWAGHDGKRVVVRCGSSSGRPVRRRRRRRRVVVVPFRANGCRCPGRVLCRSETGRRGVPRHYAAIGPARVG